jgi:nucleoside-diphosphate-sugar epimerase
MRVFVTGASGFVGSAVVQELIHEGHQVTGLARSEANAKSLAAAGAKVHRGDLEDLASLESGADASEGVIHTGFIHDFSRFKEVSEIDRRAIEAMGSVFEGTNRPLVITSVASLVTPGRMATEDDVSALESKTMPRIASEEAAASLFKRGVRVSTVRLGVVYGEGDPPHAHFVPTIVGVAREKGASAYVGNGRNRWPAVHVLDAARVYRLTVEKGMPGARYHAVGEEGVPFKDIATVIGRHLNVPVVSKTPEEAVEHFGWISGFAGGGGVASNKLTQERLGWHPVQPSLLKVLEGPYYFRS